MSLQQELLLSAVWESSAEGMRVTDFTGKIININKAFCELTGFEKTSLIGKPFTIIYDKNEQADLMNYYLEFLSSGKKKERSLKRSTFRNGKQLMIEASYSLVEILGEKHVLTIFRDITDLIKAKKARLKSEDKQRELYRMIRLMLDNSSDMVWAKDLQNRYTFVNKAMCENLLVSQDTEEPIGKDDMFFAEREREKHKDNPEWHTFGEVCRDTDSVVLKSRKPEQFNEYGNVKGKFVFLDVHKAPIFDEEGNIIGTVGSGRDVTEEKKIYRELISSQEKIKLSEEKFRTFADYTYDWEYWISPTGDIIYMSPSCERISGYKYSEFIADKDLCKKIVHSEDKEIYANHVRENKGGITAIPDIEETEYRIITKNGEVRLINHFCRHIKSADGRNLGRRVSNRDITDQKKAESALSENEERYEKLFRITPSGIILLDKNGIILESNDAVTKILQYTPEELKGKDVRELSLPERYEKIGNDITRILNGEILNNEIENIKKDGTVCIIELQEIAITLKGGSKGILATVNDITERKKAEDAEMSLRIQLNKILDLVPSYIFAKDYDGKFLMVNKSLADIFNVSPEEVVGKTDYDYGATPEQIEGYLFADRKVIDSGKEIFIKEEQVMRKDGKPGWFQTHKIPYHHPGIEKPAILGVAVDITERKKAEEILLKSESRYRALVNLAVDGILLGSNEGVITDANESMCEIIGMAKKDFIGKHISLLPFSSESIKNNPFRFDLLKKGEIVLNERVLIRPDGTEVNIEMRSKMMPDGTYQSIYRDITKRKQVESEINLKNEELFKLISEKDKFFSIIAHDLRSPFMGFLGFTNLLKSGVQYLSLEELQDIANNMNISAHNLFDLLTNLLEWSMMQRGLMPFKPERLSLKNLSEKIIDIFSDALRKKNINVESKIENDIFITADEAMINTVLRNLISNAIKFTEIGGFVTISAKKTEYNVVISVKDTGIGMSNELKNNLFRVDKKVRREGTEEEPSTGLGLLLCKEFIEKHNGEIFITSEEGKGSKFSVNLPLN
jgi:PAS domain S-box-containing protein